MSKIPPSLRGGERIGDDQWTVVRRIGEGGFAEVYEVKDSIQDTRVRPNCASVLRRNRLCSRTATGEEYGKELNPVV